MSLLVKSDIWSIYDVKVVTFFIFSYWNVLQNKLKYTNFVIQKLHENPPQFSVGKQVRLPCCGEFIVKYLDGLVPSGCGVHGLILGFPTSFNHWI